MQIHEVNEMSKMKRLLRPLIIILVVAGLLIYLGISLSEEYFFPKSVIEKEIDPEFYSGILSASSILFAFSSLIASFEKDIRKFLILLLAIPLLFIVTSVDKIVDVALGNINPVTALLWLQGSFLVNLFFTGLFSGFSISWSLFVKNKKNQNTS